MGNNDKMEAMAESKLLDYNLDKSCFIIIGKIKARLEMQKQLQNCDWLSCHGLADSVNVTVNKRKGLVTLSL